MIVGCNRQDISGEYLGKIYFRLNSQLNEKLLSKAKLMGGTDDIREIWPQVSDSL
jgi:hypothetical protein